MSKDTNSSNAKYDYLNGILGGFARALVGHPFDTVRIKLQINSEKYKNAYNCIKIVKKEQGLLSLYKGVSGPLFFNGLIVGTHFYVYDNLKNNYNPLLVGGFAGLCGSIISNPIEYIRIKMQLSSNSDNKKNYKNMRECIKCIVKNNGAAGLFTGQGITSLRETIGYAAFFGCYATCPNMFDNDFINNIFRGSLCGFALWGSMYPIDVIKTKIHGQILENTKHNELWFIKDTYKKYGIRGFYKGFGITMIRAIPVNIGIISTIDIYKSLQK